MYNFTYVDKAIWAPVKKDIECILHRVQDLVRHRFTFSYAFVGSASRKMITCDWDSNVGFDFDINIYINDDENHYSAQAQKEIIMHAVNRVAWLYGYSPCENSTRVIKIKVKDRACSRIDHSCDMAIVHDYIDKKGRKRQEYIRFNKGNGTYMWVDQSKGFNLEKKIRWLKEQSLWNEVRDTYLYVKNINVDVDKHSRSLFAETINVVCMRNGYIEKNITKGV